MDIRDALIDWDEPPNPSSETMNQATRSKHTPEQLAEWQAIHQHYKENPIQEVPKTAIKSRSFMAILELLIAFKAARESQGLAVADVAAQMGIEPAALTKLEACQELNPSISTLFRWAEVLG